ncbi:MAG TPA: hypothetical protein VKB79_09020 [Bryobacteraceae bacterium]|nr:hypothetical protein [Bryobacteraceae bacterium]
MLSAGVDDTADSPKELAMAIARRAKKAEKSGHYSQAFVLYSEATAMRPEERKYRAAMERMRPRAAEESKSAQSGEKAPAHPPKDVPPEDMFDSFTAKEVAEARPLADIPQLRARPGLQDFDLSADARTLFNRVAVAFGLEVVFDGDYPSGGQTIRFRVSRVDYREALDDLEAATGSFIIPISSKVFMAAQDNVAKRNDLERTMAVTIPIPSAVTTQELTEITQVLRQTLNIEKIGWDTADASIIIRDRVSRVLPAAALLRQLTSYRPEVMVELEFLEVTESDMATYGINLTNTYTAYYLGHLQNTMTTVPSTVMNLVTFGGGRTLFGLTVAEAQAMFNESDNKSNTLYHAQIRGVAGQPASLHIGDKYPIITSGYYGAVTTPGTVFAPPPSITFEDLGLEIKVTPYIHGMDATSLNLEASFEVLTGAAVNGIPVIGQRSFKSNADVRNGQWNIIGSMLSKTRSRAITGFWGLAQTPLFGELFKQTTKDDEDANILIGVRTSLLSLPPDQIVTETLRVGSDPRPHIPL